MTAPKPVGATMNLDAYRKRIAREKAGLPMRLRPGSLAHPKARAELTRLASSPLAARLSASDLVFAPISRSLALALQHENQSDHPWRSALPLNRAVSHRLRASFEEEKNTCGLHASPVALQSGALCKFFIWGSNYSLSSERNSLDTSIGCGVDKFTSTHSRGMEEGPCHRGEGCP